MGGCLKRNPFYACSNSLWDGVKKSVENGFNEKDRKKTHFKSFLLSSLISIQLIFYPPSWQFSPYSAFIIYMFALNRNVRFLLIDCCFSIACSQEWNFHNRFPTSRKVRRLLLLLSLGKSV